MAQPPQPPLILRLALYVACGAFVSFVPRAASAAAPNDRSPMGINLSGVTYYSTEFPFVDVFKASKPWVFQKKGQKYGVGDRHRVGEDGYPKEILPEHFAEALVLVTDGHYPGGEYVCLYDGRGRLEFAYDAKAAKEEAGRVMLQVTPTSQIAVRIAETDPANPVRNIRLMRRQFEPTYRTEPFDPGFLERWADMKVLRFMDWQRTNGSPLKEWADRAKVAGGTYDTPRGVPVEVMVDLANRLDADPWFCVPHLASDDFVRQFAQLVKSRLEPGRRVYVEYGNECWNGAFPQARYCAERGKALNLSDNAFQAQLRYYSQRSVEVFAIWDEVFGAGERGRLVRVLGSQHANPWASEQVLGWKDAAGHADALAVAPYFGHEFGDPQRVDATLQLSPAQVIERLTEDLEKTREQTARHAKLAKEHRLELVAYEGGQHLVGHGGAENNPRLTDLLIAANRHPKMKQVYLKDLENWKKAGGGMFVTFSSVAKPSKWGSWGLLESSDQDPAAAPKFQAVKEFLAR